MPKVNEVVVRFDDDQELVIDNIGGKVSPIELGFRMASAVYRVIAGEADDLEGEGVIYGGFKS